MAAEGDSVTFGGSTKGRPMLSYDEEASKFSAKPFPEEKPAAENVVREEWKRRMESFETSFSVKKKMFPEQSKIPASLIAKRFVNSAIAFKTDPSQESEVDIDWLLSSDEEELHICEMRNTENSGKNFMHAVVESHCPDGSTHDDLTPDIEIINSPAFRNCPFIQCKPVFDRSPVSRRSPIIGSGQVSRHSPTIQNSPVIRHSPVIENSPVIRHSPVIENSPVVWHSPANENSPIIRHSPVIENSPVIRHSPVIENSPVIRHSPVTENSPVIRHSPVIENCPVTRCFPVFKNSPASPVIHSQRRNRLQNSFSNLISCTAEDEQREMLMSFPTDSSDDGEDIKSLSGRQSDFQSQLSHSQVPISQYDSQEDVNSSEDDVNEEDACADENVSISSPPGSQLESNLEQSVPVPASSSKGKDLIEGLQRYFLTPEKNPQPEDDTAAATSTTKKKQKFIKGGFAERLYKLTTRQRTATACWLHKKQKASGNAASDRVLACDVTSCLTDHGHVVAKCRVTRGNMLDASSLIESLVLFSQETAQRCNIKSGSLLKIYPPWQSLKMDNWDVVLNTNLCKVESQEEECQVDGQEVSETLGPDRILASWTCSCSLEPHSCFAVCRQSSASRSSTFQCRPVGSLSARSSGLTSDGATKALETCSLSTIVPLAQETLLSSSILEGIEQKGGSVAMEIDFYATIQRIFCRVAQHSLNDSWSGENRVSSETGSWVQWSLLVQDLHGFLCEVILPRNLAPNSSWHKVTTTSLGSQWAFHNLRVGRRLTRPKSGRLFSIIDSVWRLNSSSGNGSPEDSASSHHETSAPSFCYSLHAADVGTSCRLWSDTTAHAFSPHIFRSLGSIVFDETSGRGRVSFAARLLYRLELELVQHFYVTDCSLQEETSVASRCPYVTVVVSNAVVVSSDYSKQLLIVFHDVYVEYGQFQADEYSRVVAGGSDRLSVMNFSPSIPLLTFSSELHSLVTFSGCVTDVDEETACTWSVCELCENSELGTSLQNSFLYCHNCKRPVTNPLTKMKLDICMAVSTLPDIVVKVKLLQKTIERLLPSTEYDEGYDIEQVLGQQIVELTCFITAVTKIGQCNKQINVDEISLNLP